MKFQDMIFVGSTVQWAVCEIKGYRVLALLLALPAALSLPATEKLGESRLPPAA